MIINVNIADSFVKANKLTTDSAIERGRPSSGEARLYVGSSKNNVESFFDFDASDVISYRGKEYEVSSLKCSLSKKNLIKYMNEAQNEYLNPSQNYYFDVSDEYFKYLKEILKLDDQIEFQIFNHKGEKDNDRVYINSSHEIWDLFRRILLPKITTVKIEKVVGSLGEETLKFGLKLDQQFKRISDIDKENLSITSLKSSKVIDDNFKTDILISTMARRGHGKFRNDLFEDMPACPFTGITDRSILRASHIKPWSASNSSERLDFCNGLTLTPTFDTLFDKGLISFDDDGELLVSSLLSKKTLKILEIKAGEVYNINNEDKVRTKYLKYHRKHIFKK